MSLGVVVVVVVVAVVVVAAAVIWLLMPHLHHLTTVPDVLFNM